MTPFPEKMFIFAAYSVGGKVPPKYSNLNLQLHDMKRILLLMALVTQTLLMAGADRIVKANDPAISFTGRTETLDDGSVRYDWVGVYMQTRFTGGRIAVEVAETGTSYHNIYIDDRFVRKIKITGKNRQFVTLAADLSKGPHTLKLQKCTEGEFGCTTVSAVRVAAGARLLPVAPRERLIEVYGDSYTCGYGTEGKSAHERFRLETENCDKAYACIIARYFGADYRLIAHSGMGMVRNYNDSVQLSRHNMSTRSTQLYDDFNRTAYDFSNCRKPDLVMINLGSNDFSTLVKPTPEQFVNTYLKMIDNIRSHYGNVPVLCVTPHSASRYLLAALDYLRERLMNKYSGVYMANSMAGIVTQAADTGSDHHPNYQGQCKIAMSLIPQISAITTWNLADLF